jgi:hypothetical protein
LIGGGLRILARPYLVFLYVCLVYLAFPSNHFNADALHYNIVGFMSIDDPAVLLRDESVPTHLLWHLLAAGLVALVHPADPRASLYILRILNIALALGSIFLFMRLVRSYAGEGVTAWATLMLAFSQACLRYFLSVEVYSLNNLVLMLVLLFIHRLAARTPFGPGPGDLAVLALLAALAIATHLANVLLVPSIALWLCARGGFRGAGRGTLFGLGAGALVLSIIEGIALLRSIGFADALRYFFNYSGKKGTYLSPDVLGNVVLSARSGLAAVIDPGGIWLLLPMAIFLVYAARHFRAFARDPWVELLVIHLCVAGAFLSQWDPDNSEHKIAVIPVLLLLVTFVHARIGRPLRGAALAGALLVVMGVVLSGIAHGVLPYTRLETYPLYQLSSEIHDRAGADDVLVVGLASSATGHAVTLSSMTFFNQRVAVLSTEDTDFEERARDYERRGFVVLRYLDGRFVR